MVPEDSTWPTGKRRPGARPKLGHSAWSGLGFHVIHRHDDGREHGATALGVRWPGLPPRLDLRPVPVR